VGDGPGLEPRVVAGVVGRIPRADVLAPVAAERQVGMLAERLDEGAPSLDGLVGEAPARVHDAGLDDGARGAGLDARAAAAAAVVILVILMTGSFFSGVQGGLPANDQADAPKAENTAPKAENTMTEPSSEKETNAPANQNAKVIKPSELITLEDAKTITEQDWEIYVSDGVEKLDQPESTGPGLRTVYESGYLGMLQISVLQNEPIFTEAMKSNFEDADDALKIQGIGDWAHIVHESGSNSIYFGYGDTFITINLSGKFEMKAYDKEELAAWEIEMVTELGKLAFERLKAMA